MTGSNPNQLRYQSVSFITGSGFGSYPFNVQFALQLNITGNTLMDMQDILSQKKTDQKKTSITLSLNQKENDYLEKVSQQLGLTKRTFAHQLFDYAINEMVRTQKEISLLNKNGGK